MGLSVATLPFEKASHHGIHDILQGSAVQRALGAPLLPRGWSGSCFIHWNGVCGYEAVAEKVGRCVLNFLVESCGGAGRGGLAPTGMTPSSTYGTMFVLNFLVESRRDAN